MPDEPRKVSLRFELFHYTTPIVVSLAQNERVVCVGDVVGEYRKVWIGDDRWDGVAVVEAADLGNICRAGAYD